jgi:hypothetical protein
MFSISYGFNATRCSWLFASRSITKGALARKHCSHTFTHKYDSCSLALGLLDCALVNAYIVHREVFKREDKTPLSHAEFLTTLHQHLLDVRPSDPGVEGNEVGFLLDLTCWM